MTRTDLLNFLIKKYDLKSYCELGTQNKAQNFNKIECTDKFCVDIDPIAQADFTGSTDDFFAQLDRKYDLYFIDASHIAEYVRRDFENALNFLNPNGIICLHDCNPLKEEHTIVPRPTERGHWHGDVYKFAASLLTSDNSYTINIDCGCLVYKNTMNGQYARLNREITWDYFDKNRKELLNLISWDEFVKLNL